MYFVESYTAPLTVADSRERRSALPIILVVGEYMLGRKEGKEGRKEGRKKERKKGRKEGRKEGAYSCCWC